MTDSTPKDKSLIALIRDVPRLVSALVQSEIELAKAEVIGKLKTAGLGAGLLAAAGVFAILFLAMLLTSAVLALALVMPGWLAALIVAFVVLLIAVLAALIGVSRLKQSMPPVPEQAMRSVEQDLRVIKGFGRRNS